MKFNKSIFKDVKKDEIDSFQKWLNVKEIYENSIILNSGQQLSILKVAPINFNLKSRLEQSSILNSYKVFLKNLNSEIQIVISSKKTDVSTHLDEILKNTKENPQIDEMSRDYIELVNSIIEEKGTITKEFYIVIKNSNNIQNDILKIKEYLTVCGNYVEECNKEQIINLFESFLNKRLINIKNFC